MPTPWICDTSAYPLVELRLPEHCDPRDVEQESFFRQVDALLERHTRIATLHDLRFAERLDAARRKRFADWIKERDAALRRLVVAHAPVVATNLQRGAVTALLWIVEAPAPTRVFTDPAEARAWLRERLEADRQGR